MYRQSGYKFTVLMNKVTTANHILRLSSEQWRLFNTSSWKWMGNFLLEDDSTADFGRKNQLALAIFKKSITVVQ